MREASRFKTMYLQPHFEKCVQLNLAIQCIALHCAELHCSGKNHIIVGYGSYVDGKKDFLLAGENFNCEHTLFVHNSLPVAFYGFFWKFFEVHWT